MSKYKEERTSLGNTSQGWTKSVRGVKYYRKDNWIIESYNRIGISIDYFIIDESYIFGYYLTGDKQDFLEEKRKLAYKNTLVWKALHGEYNDE